MTLFIRIARICKEESFLPVEPDTFKLNITVKHMQSIGYPVEMFPAQENTGKMPNELVTSWFKHMLVGSQRLPSPRLRAPAAVRMGMVEESLQERDPVPKSLWTRLQLHNCLV